MTKYTPNLSMFLPDFQKKHKLLASDTLTGIEFASICRDFDQWACVMSQIIAEYLIEEGYL